MATKANYGDRNQPKEAGMINGKVNGDKNKVVVIGLDCAEPGLVFQRFRGQLPNLERLMARGVSGPLRSL